MFCYAKEDVDRIFAPLDKQRAALKRKYKITDYERALEKIDNEEAKMTAILLRRLSNLEK